jgi:hypothetical protein
MHCNEYFEAMTQTRCAERLLCRIVAVLLIVQSSVALLVPLAGTSVVGGKVIVLCTLLPSASGRPGDSGVPLDSAQATICPALMLGNAFASVLPTLPQHARLPAAGLVTDSIARTDVPQQRTLDGTNIRAPPSPPQPLIRV